jgi:hypothetical protein
MLFTHGAAQLSFTQSCEIPGQKGSRKRKKLVQALFCFRSAPGSIQTKQPFMLVKTKRSFGAIQFPDQPVPMPGVFMIPTGTDGVKKHPTQAELRELSLHGNLDNGWLVDGYLC